MQGEHWRLIAYFRQKLTLVVVKYSFLKHQYKQMMPASLQSDSSVCGFYTIFAAFHLFNFRQEEITGVLDVNVFSFISIYMKFLNFSNVNVQVIQCLCFFLYTLINFLQH